MGEINFLEQNKSGGGNAGGGRKKNPSQIRWTTPEDDSLSEGSDKDRSAGVGQAGGGGANGEQEPARFEKNKEGAASGPGKKDGWAGKGIWDRLKGLISSGKPEDRPISRPGGKTAAENRSGHSEREMPVSGRNGVAPVRTLKTNLIIEGEAAAFVDWKKNSRQLALVVSTVCLSLALVYVVMIFWEKIAVERAEYLTQKIEQSRREIAGLEEDIRKNKMDSFQKKLKLARNLLDSHVYWTDFFSFLEKNTLANVYYNAGFSGNTSGIYSIQARTDNFSAIRDQVKAMRLDDAVVRATAGSGEEIGDKKGGGGAKKDDPYNIEFDLELVVKPEIFTR